MLFYSNSDGAAANVEIWTEVSTGSHYYIFRQKPCSGGGRAVHFLSINAADCAHIPVWTSLYLLSAHPDTPSVSPIVWTELDPHTLPSDDFTACSESSTEWMHDCWKQTPSSCLISSRPYKSPLYGLPLWLPVLEWTLRLYCQLPLSSIQHGQEILMDWEIKVPNCIFPATGVVLKSL